MIYRCRCCSEQIPHSDSVCPKCGYNNGADTMEAVLTEMLRIFGQKELCVRTDMVSVFGDLAPDLQDERLMLKYLYEVDGPAELFASIGQPAAEALLYINRVISRMKSRFISEESAWEICGRFLSVVGGSMPQKEMSSSNTGKNDRADTGWQYKESDNHDDKEDKERKRKTNGGPAGSGPKRPPLVPVLRKWLICAATVLVLAGALALFHRHDWLEATCTTPRICVRCGMTRGVAPGHKWREADCVSPRTCTVCGATEGIALGHQWAPASFTLPQTCLICGMTEGEAIGQKWLDSYYSFLGSQPSMADFEYLKDVTGTSIVLPQENELLPSYELRRVKSQHGNSIFYFGPMPEQVNMCLNVLLEKEPN